jgi:UPF0716 protein FxsA
LADGEARPVPFRHYHWIVVWLFVAFIVLPVVEIWLLTQVAGQIGWALALFLVIGVSAAGAWLVRREGLGVIRRIQAALNDARMPANELADGAMIFFASALMLTPGFLTDAVGLALLIPPIRAVLRPPLISFFRRRVDLRVGGLGNGGAGFGRSFGTAGPFGAAGPFGRPGHHGRPGRDDDIIDVDERPDQRPDDPNDTPPELR